MKHRLHVVSLPNTQTTKDYPSCAFTQKVIKFCQMMMAEGNEVYLYASEENEAPCTELIPCITKEEQRKYLNTDHYVKVSFDVNTKLWQIFNGNLIKEIKKRKQSGDFLCLCMGSVFNEVANAVDDGMFVVETGIGYSATFAPYQVFESYAQQHAIYAQNRDSSRADGRFFDEVIPNYFDIKDFPFNGKKEDYYLYVGRMIQRKGLKIIEEIAKYGNKKIILAGMGAKQVKQTILGQDITIVGDNLEYIGEVDFKKRGKLMSKATAVICPTIYVEPFCGVSIEAMLCGTPVITTDWGAFTETVKNGENGFRCRNLSDFIQATEDVKKLDYKKIREDAINVYSLGVIQKRYQKYFDKLYTLREKGWYTLDN